MREVQRELKQLIRTVLRSEEHTSELQSRLHLVCRLLLEKKNLTLSPPCPRTIVCTRHPCSFTSLLVRIRRANLAITDPYNPSSYTPCPLRYLPLFTHSLL